MRPVSHTRNIQEYTLRTRDAENFFHGDKIVTNCRIMLFLPCFFFLYGPKGTRGDGLVGHRKCFFFYLLFDIVPDSVYVLNRKNKEGGPLWKTISSTQLNW